MYFEEVCTWLHFVRYRRRERSAPSGVWGLQQGVTSKFRRNFDFLDLQTIGAVTTRLRNLAEETYFLTRKGGMRTDFHAERGKRMSFSLFACTTGIHAQYVTVSALKQVALRRFDRYMTDIFMFAH